MNKEKLLQYLTKKHEYYLKYLQDLEQEGRKTDYWKGKADGLELTILAIENMTE